VILLRNKSFFSVSKSIRSKFSQFVYDSRVLIFRQCY